MKKARLVCILSMITLALAAFSSCNEPVEKPDTNPEVPENPDEKPDDNPDEKPGDNTDTTVTVMPTVVLSADDACATRTSVTFTVTATDSEQVRYVIYESEGSELPDAAYILNEGKQVRADKPTTVTVDELTSSTDYTIVAAAKAGEHEVVSEPLTIRTLDEAPEIPEPEDPQPDPSIPVVTDSCATMIFTSVTNYPLSDPTVVCLTIAYADDNYPDVVAEGTLYFNLGQESEQLIPAGTYSVEDGQLSSGYTPSHLRIWDYAAGTNVRYNFTSGQVTVLMTVNEEGKDIYTLELDVIGENISAMYPKPYQITASYTGEIVDVSLE